MKRYELLKQAINNHGYCSVDKQNMDMIEKEIRADERAKIFNAIAEIINLDEEDKQEMIMQITEQMKGGTE